MQERTGAESEDVVDGSSQDWSMPQLNVVSVRVPSAKSAAGGQVIQLTLRNDTTAGQLLHTVCEVSNKQLGHYTHIHMTTSFTESETECIGSFCEVENANTRWIPMCV